jgi:hypothetical protein
VRFFGNSSPSLAHFNLPISYLPFSPFIVGAGTSFPGLAGVPIFRGVDRKSTLLARGDRAFHRDSAAAHPSHMSSPLTTRVAFLTVQQLQYPSSPPMIGTSS